MPARTVGIYGGDKAAIWITVESLVVFIHLWINTTPTLPEPAAQAARTKANEHHEAFVTAPGRRLARGQKLRHEVSEDVAGSDQDAAAH